MFTIITLQCNNHRKNSTDATMLISTILDYLFYFIFLNLKNLRGWGSPLLLLKIWSSNQKFWSTPSWKQPETTGVILIERLAIKSWLFLHLQNGTKTVLSHFLLVYCLFTIYKRKKNCNMAYHHIPTYIYLYIYTSEHSRWWFIIMSCPLFN